MDDLTVANRGKATGARSRHATWSEPRRRMDEVEREGRIVHYLVRWEALQQ
jgi:hypothetical protein